MPAPPMVASDLADARDLAMAEHYAEQADDQLAMPAAPAAPAPAPTPAPAAPVAASGGLHDADDWLAFVASSELSGPARELAANSAFVAHADGVLRLALTDGFDYLQTDRSLQQLEQALTARFGGQRRIVFGTGQAQAETLHARQDRERNERQDAAQAAFLGNAHVRTLVEQQGARVVPDSIRPYQE